MLVVIWPTPEQETGSEVEHRIETLDQLWALVYDRPILDGYCNEISSIEGMGQEHFLVVAYVATAD